MAYAIGDNTITVYQHDAPTTVQATIDADDITSLKTNEQVSYVGDELVYDTMTVDAIQKRTFTDGTNAPTYGTDLQDFSYGSPAEYTNVSGSLDKKFYVEESNKTGVHAWSYDCVSAIGLLDRQMFGGNVYSFATFATVLAAIVGSSGDIIDYDVSAVSSIEICGWIPYGTKREALQQLLFATNVHMFWDDANTQYVFDYIDHTVASTIADANVFDSGKLEYPQLATKVQVTEHTFYYKSYLVDDDDYVTLFDNTGAYTANGELVKFSNAPIVVSTITATGSLTYTSLTTDSAIVTGRGTLVGVPYFHSTYVLERDTTATDRQEYEVSVTDAYLVTLLNSENVVDRLADYWFNRFHVKNDIIVSNESCGNYYTVKDAFGTSRTGYMQKMDKVFSSFVRASCELLCGVNEEYEGNNFNYYHIIFYNANGDPNTSALTGTWTVPTGVTKIRVVLVGGGTGGDSGFPGEPGTTSGEGGDGGDPGDSGAGGNIYVMSLDVTPGDVFNFSLGQGGSGGAELTYATYQTQGTNNAGSAGSATTFTDPDGNVYSSANGSPSEDGTFAWGLGTVVGRTGLDMSWGAGGAGGAAGVASDVSTETDKRSGSDGESLAHTTVPVFSASGGSGGSGVYTTAPTSFAIVNAMTAAAIVSAGVYIRSNGSTSLQTPTTSYATAMKNYASGAISYCNALGWTNPIGVAGGGGGGAAFGGTAGAGGAGYCGASYPTCLVIDEDNKLRDDDSFCWHEINTTKGGNGGAGATPGYFSKFQFSQDSTYGFNDVLGIGGRGGFGGGGGGGAAASRSGEKSVSWFLSQFGESPTTPTAGSGGNGGKGQDGSDGGIIIYF